MNVMLLSVDQVWVVRSAYLKENMVFVVFQVVSCVFWATQAIFHEHVRELVLMSKINHQASQII